MKPIKVGVDTGGTFTDFVMCDHEGRLTRWKVLSTPEDPTSAILEGLKALGLIDPRTSTPPFRAELIHGTTVGTNAFLERKGAKTVLMTTKGFEDCLFIGRQARDQLYDLNLPPRRPIIPRDHILGLEERMSWQGHPITPLAADEIEKALRFIKKNGAESVACTFLHAYASDRHERAVHDAVTGTGTHCSISSRVLPRFREYERLTTTLVNAYIGPVIGRYIARLTDMLNHMHIFVQLSNGGMSPSDLIEDHAVKTLLSGPAGGVQGAWALAIELGLKGIITFDMGGTSTDCSICPGELSFTRSYSIEGYPVATPLIDIHTVGAGGGSMAWIDKGGILKVGPESAGADPGPVCYGKGDTITVTDANCFLGRLIPEAFLGGRMRLWPNRIGPRLEALGCRLGLGPRETALGILRIVNNNMVQALRAISVERGFDPRDFVLVTFGGAGGLHAAYMAQELGMDKVLFPALGGVFSALGMVNSHFTMEREKALFLRTRHHSCRSRLEEELMSMREEIMYEYSNSQGLPSRPFDAVHETAFIEARYMGQSHELQIPFEPSWIQRFHETHERLYGYSRPGAEVEITGLRLRITFESTHSSTWHTITSHSNASCMYTKLPKKVPIHFEDGLHLTSCLYRSKLSSGQVVKGPVLIIDEYTTILCPNGWAVRNDHGHLIMEKTGYTG